MELSIGRKIKELRKKQDITQEKLAAYLNISYQAVSKWENGLAYPDITMLPSIANFFKVSVDELLGTCETEDEGKLKVAHNKFKENLNKGKIFENITLCRDIIEEYPRNYQWMYNLASSLLQYQATDEQLAYSKAHGFEEEVIEVCERILEDCTIDSIRQGTVQILCELYPKNNRTKEALMLANQMPDISMSKEVLLGMIYRGEEQIKQQQETLLKMIDMCGNILITLSFDRYMGMDLTYEEKIKYVEAANSLYKTLLVNEEDGLFYCRRFSWNYRRLAELWCALGDRDRAMENLLLAEKNALAYDKLEKCGIQSYKSVFINRCEYDPKEIERSLEGNEASMLYFRTTEGVFDIMRDLPEFSKLQERLLKNKFS